MVSSIERLKNSLDLYILVKLVKPYTMIDPLRLSMLYKLAQEAAGKDKGDIVECGVCNGGSAAVLVSAIRGSSARRLWLYDTFEGIPPASGKDGLYAQEFKEKLVGSMDKVKEVLRKVKFPLEWVVFRKGHFKDTFREQLPEKIALLHIDADWYESVLFSLKTFYSQVVEGGIIILDDFGHWEGARQAFYDFCAEYKIKPLIERVGYTQAFWRKGKENNRG